MVRGKGYMPDPGSVGTSPQVCGRGSTGAGLRVCGRGFEGPRAQD